MPMELVLFDDDEDEKPKKRKQTSKSKSKSKTKTQNNKRRTTTNGSSAKRKPAQNGKSRAGSTRKTNSTYKPRKTSTANRGGGFYLGGDGEGLTLGENRKSTSSKSKKSKSDDDFLTFEIGGSRSEDRPARKSHAPARSGKSTRSGKSAKSTKYTNARSGTAKSSKSDYNRGGLMLMDDEDDEREYRPKSQKSQKSPMREHQQKSNEDWTTPSSSTKSKSKSESDEEVGLMEGLSKFSHDFRRKRGNATMRKYLSDEEIGDINEDRASKLELAKERKYEKKGERKEKVKKVYDKSKDVTKDVYDSAKSLYGKTKEKTSAYLENYKNKKDQKFIDTWLPSDFDREGKSTEELLEIAQEQKEWKDNLRKQGRDEEKAKIKKQNEDNKRLMEEGREEDMRAFADQYLMESEKTGDVKKDYKLAKKIQAGQKREVRKAEAKRKAEERKKNRMQKKMNKETNGEMYGPVRPSEAEINLPNATAVDTGVKHGPPTKVEAIRENIARMEEQRKAEGKNDY